MSMVKCYLIISCAFRNSQREVSRAQDLAAKVYKETTAKEKQTGHGVWLAMHHAQQKTIKILKGRNFEKFIAVANPHNGPKFFDEVRIIYYCFLFDYP